MSDAQRADLRAAQLDGASLAGIRLAGARSAGATLYGAGLSKTKGLTEKQLPTAFSDDQTYLPPDLTHVREEEPPR